MLRDLSSTRSLFALFAKVKSCLKVMFQCETVTLMLKFPKLCDLYRAESGTSTIVFEFLKEKFHIVVNNTKDVENIASLDPNIEPRHIKAGFLAPNEINWPVLSSENFSSKKWLYLLINIKGYPHNNYRNGDGLLINLLSH